MIKLSILIPSIKRHEKHLANLLAELNAQKLPHGDQIEILVDDSEIDSIGEKRNRLLKKAQGKYIAFFDADDLPSENYINWVMEGVEKNVDCCSLKGEITVDGGLPDVFEHSLQYNKWETVEGADIKYLRFPNHLNTIKAIIAKKFLFPEKNFGEDFDWSTKLHNSGLLKTEHYIPGVIYYYNYVSDKTK